MIIPSRFNGPPGAANGGVVAAAIAGDAPAEVTIRRPVPVDVELDLDGGNLRGPGEEVFAEARALSEPEVEQLRAAADETPVVSLDEARAAGERSPLGTDHPFPTCFGCGPENEHGIHCLAGPVGRDDLWAVAYTPPSGDPPYVWAALDCPSSAPHVGEALGVPHVLGRIAGVQLAPLEAGAEHAVVAWSLGSDGRKRFSVSVIQDAAGEPVAVARATWVALPR